MPKYEIQEEPKESYIMHPVVHRWVSHLDSDQQNRKFVRLALTLVGLLVPTRWTKEYWILQQRILPHAERCSWWIHKDVLRLNEDIIRDSYVIDSIHGLGILYADQGKLREAEEMYDRAL
jgi:hypothetical protein